MKTKLLKNGKTSFEVHTGELHRPGKSDHYQLAGLRPPEYERVPCAAEVEQYPDLAMAVKLLPLYQKMQDYRQKIWGLQGGFFPPMDKFRTHEFRAQIAEILRKMGGVCDEILAAY